MTKTTTTVFTTFSSPDSVIPEAGSRDCFIEANTDKKINTTMKKKMTCVREIYSKS